MNEKLLQYIWQFQCYNPNHLITEAGEPMQVIQPGQLNTNQGPDFTGAKIKISATTWAGSVELHINSSDWHLHKHSTDKNYKNVILHVVWKNDIDLDLPFSTLVLEDRVPKILLNKYHELMLAESFIPCEKSIHQLNPLSWKSWKTRMLVERLEQKTSLVLDFLEKNNNNWEASFWWLLARNFGARLNTLAFEKTAQSIPINILARHKNQVHQTEALLFGQAGLLEGAFKDDYPKLLQREYRFLKNKYGLKPIEASLVFLRMRPSNFPTVRLAQLAMLIHKSVHLFSKIKESHDLHAARELLHVTANDYWHYHYVFDEPAAFKKKNLGDQMTDNILINTIVPVLFAYGMYNSEQGLKDKAMHWLEQIKTEKNNIVKGFTALGIASENAFDSQALIRLKHEYCNNKRCLDCSVGNHLIRGSN